MGLGWSNYQLKAEVRTVALSFFSHYIKLTMMNIRLLKKVRERYAILENLNRESFPKGYRVGDHWKYYKYQLKDLESGNVLVYSDHREVVYHRLQKEVRKWFPTIRNDKGGLVPRFKRLF